MPRIFIAFRKEKVKGVPKRLVTGGLSNIKKMMKEHNGTSWMVALYNFKPSVENICAMLSDITTVEAEESYEFEVNDSGRLKEVT